MRLAKIERKIEYFPIIGGEIKATNDEKGITEGYLNYIGNIDFGDDMTMKGAFQTTLKDSYARKSAQGLDYLWPYLWNHDYNILPPGGIFDADEDRKGLYVKTQYILDIQLGRELYSSFKMGTMKKQSMGYKAIKVDWEQIDGRRIRKLLEVAVMEGSAVVFPMNDMAQVDTVKNGRRNFYMPNKLPTKQATPAVITTKDYAADYLATTQQDWVSDLWNLWYPLRNAITQAFVIGDQPAEDVDAALDQFGTAVRAYVQHMTEFLQPDDDDTSQSPMYMSADDNPETKDAKKLSAASHAKMTKSIDGAMAHLKEVKSELSRQRANALQGYQVYAGNEPPDTKQEDNPENKEEDEKNEDEATRLNKKRSAAYDLASMLQFQNAERGI